MDNAKQNAIEEKLDGEDHAQVKTWMKDGFDVSFVFSHDGEYTAAYVNAMATLKLVRAVDALTEQVANLRRDINTR